jgi:hypothetical protein
MAGLLPRAVDSPWPFPAHSTDVSRFFARRFVAILALAVLLLPALPLSIIASHGDDMAMMACCVADHCNRAALSAPCCTHDSASPAASTVPATPASAHDTTLLAHWAALVFDIPTLAAPGRADALAATIRGRPPDPPHLLFGVFLI